MWRGRKEGMRDRKKKGRQRDGEGESEEECSTDLCQL